MAKHYYRPRNEMIRKYADRFPSINLFTVDAVFGGWLRLKKYTSGMAESLNKLQQLNFDNPKLTSIGGC